MGKKPAERAAEAFEDQRKVTVEGYNDRDDKRAQWLDISVTSNFGPDVLKLYGDHIREALHHNGLVITGIMQKDHFDGDLRIWVSEIEDIETTIEEEEVVETRTVEKNRLVTK